MDLLTELLDYFNWLRLPQTLLANWIHAGDPLALRASWAFFVPMSAGYSARQLQTLLAHYGITSWDYSFFRGEISFRVRIGQARFAQRILQKNGVPLLHGLLA